jgi:hypothetical protein
MPSLWHKRSHLTQVSIVASSEVKGQEGAVEGASSFTASAATIEVCFCQSEWQTKEEQIRPLQEKAAEAQSQPWL